MMKVKNIIFTDFMGNGRNTIARALAKDLDFIFLDNDDSIETKFDQKISETFKEKGEAFFKQEEQKVANLLCSCNGASIASDGGFVYVLDSDKMGFCIYLKASLEYLKKRLSEDGAAKRPLLYDEVQAKRLYDERLNKYEQKADLILDVGNKSIDELMIEIRKVMK